MLETQFADFFLSFFDARLLDVSSQSNAYGPDEDRWFG